MRRPYLLRICIGLALFSGVFVLPYWLVILLGVVAAVFIPFYIEFIALVAILEMLYHSGGDTATTLLYPALLFALFVILEASRGVIRERVLQI